MFRQLMTVTAAAVLTVASLPSSPAHACGGFFCSQFPVDQTGEQIVFLVDEGTVSAVIQIAYQGDAEDFAWVVPVASAPQIGVAPQPLFEQLRWRTDPQFYLSITSRNGTCGDYAYPPEMAFDGAAGGGNEVTVVDESQVGPYDTVTLDSSDAQALIDWLNANGFDQPPESLPLIEHYVNNDMLFVALKLQKGASTGEIQPVKLTFQEQNPCVPLILTQVAASEDMPVRLWVLGDHRAVPLNWFHVELNLKKINWFSQNYYGGFGGPFGGGGAGADNNYDALLTQAVNEAAGHGFHTEFAGKTSELNLENALYNENRFDLAALQALTDPAQFVSEALSQGFPRDSAMQALLRKHIPMPQELIDQGVEERDFYNNLENYAQYFAAMNFDPVAFVADLDERIITPLKDAQAMLEAKPYLTRLYSTVSPDEMTRDPLFGFNPDLPDVSNIHNATAEYICSPADGTATERVKITLENGDQFEVEGPFDEFGQPINPPDFPSEPAAAKIELLGTSGLGKEVVAADAVAVDKELDAQNPETVLNNLVTPDITTPVTPPISSNDEGCQGSGGGNSMPLAVLLALGALVLTTRRRA